MKTTKSLLATSYRTLLFVVLMLLLNGAATAQNQAVRFSKQQISAQKALNEIRAQTGLGIAYDGSRFDVNRVVNFTSQNLTIDQAMRQIIEESEFEYAITHNVIIIKEREEKKIEPVILGEKTGDSYAQNSPNDFSATPVVRKEQKQEERREPVRESQTLDSQLPMTSHKVPHSAYMPGGDKLPAVALKINLLYGATTLTPNLGLELGLSQHSTLEFSGSYNPWNRKGDSKSNKKLVHMILRGNYRYWLCERYNGNFVGGGAIYAQYNIGGHRFPGIFNKEHRYRGYGVGAEVTYGVNFILGKKWGLEVGASVGVVHLKYDRYDCALCDRQPVKGSKTYFGPTNLMVSFVFLIK